MDASEASPQLRRGGLMKSGARVPRRLAPALWGLAVLALLAAALEAVVRGGLVPKLVVASPTETAAAIWRLAAEEGLFRALGATLLTALGAVAAAVAVGL